MWSRQGHAAGTCHPEAGGGTRLPKAHRQARSRQAPGGSRRNKSNPASDPCTGSLIQCLMVELASFNLAISQMTRCKLCFVEAFFVAMLWLAARDRSRKPSLFNARQSSAPLRPRDRRGINKALEKPQRQIEVKLRVLSAYFFSPTNASGHIPIPHIFPPPQSWATRFPTLRLRRLDPLLANHSAQAPRTLSCSARIARSAHRPHILPETALLQNHCRWNPKLTARNTID